MHILCITFPLHVTVKILTCCYKRVYQKNTLLITLPFPCITCIYHHSYFMIYVKVKIIK
ncbi:hypothetical protein CKO_03554 [Citrobacter koseri ATCC BAA-895]|uniref:Uncharacterized protein n=1 Tax=Citrobacter koseri (strain ATCC BAA-895 / CDC 4225-83 / SGSC4696) TaxID=290338 RepID=A8AMC0_CITK8|nr:hypothetical protein CKO_03554 [Citrobacter koseri ATCC BAA-895]